MKKRPEELNADTPDWFKDWHNKSFWHFQYGVESRLAFHEKLIYTILAAIIVVAIANIFV